MPRRADPPVEIEGVTLTHPEKVLWPEDGITKRDLAEYHAQVAPYLLPFVGGRALTLRLFPRGVGEPGVFMQDAPKGVPDWVRTWCDVGTSTGRAVDHIVADDARTLVWLAQYNVIEVHAWLSRVESPDRPDFAVVDLDPSDTTPFTDVVAVARLFREALDRVGVVGFPKLTGSSGIHIFVPLAPGRSFDEVRASVHALCRRIEERAPDLATTDPHIKDRGDRVYLDYAGNARGKTAVAPYSARPKPGAPVAAPLRWEDLDDPDLRPDRWTIRTLLARLAEVGDLVAPLLAGGQRLPPTWD